MAEEAIFEVEEEDGYSEYMQLTQKTDPDQRTNQVRSYSEFLDSGQSEVITTTSLDSVQLMSAEEKQAQLFEKFAHNDVIKEEEELATVSSRTSPMFKSDRGLPIFSSSNKTVWKVTSMGTDVSQEGPGKEQKVRNFEICEENPDLRLKESDQKGLQLKQSLNTLLKMQAGFPSRKGQKTTSSNLNRKPIPTPEESKSQSMDAIPNNLL